METKSRTEYSFLNIITGIGGYIVSLLLSLIGRIIFTKCLPPAYLGISGLFSNILSMLSLAELGIGGAIVYALYKPIAENDKEKISSLVKLFGDAYRIIGIVIGIMGLCLIPFLKLIIPQQPDIIENMYIIYLLYLFNTASSYFFTYRSTLLVAAQMNYLCTGLNYLVLSIQAILQGILLIITKQYYVYLTLQILGTFVYNLWISYIATKKFPYIKDKRGNDLSKEEKMDIFKNVRDLMAYKISGVLVNSTDNIIITVFDGLSLTGLVSNYTLLVNTLNTLFLQLFNGLSASVGNLNAIESNEKKKFIFDIVNFMNFWIFAWGAVGIIVVSNDLVHALFGEKYVLGIQIPIVLALNFYTVGMQNAVHTYKHTMGLFKYGRFLQFGTAFFNLLFSIVLGKKFGLIGILFATFLARLLTNLWYDPYIIYKIALKRNPIKYLKKYVAYLLLLILDVLICYMVCNYIRCTIVVQVILKMVLTSIITNLFFVAIFINSKEFKYLISVVNRLKRKIFK